MLKGDPPSSLEGIDTAILFDLFRRHRLFPLAPLLFPLLDEEERERWKKAVQNRTLRSLQLTAVLTQLVTAFRKKEIDAIPLKGPLLSQLLYGNPGARHSQDLDILIPHEDAQHIIDIARNMGFLLVSPKQDLSTKQWNYYSKHLKHFSLVNTVQNVLVELHTRIEDSLVMNPFEMESFLEEMEIVEVNGQPFKVLNKNKTFLYLTLHGGAHLYKRLFWLRDVSEALKRWNLNHQKILSDAKFLGIERLLGLSLLLVREFFNTTIPTEYSSFLEENKKHLSGLVNSSIRMILGNDKPRFIVNIRQHIFNFRILPGLSYKFKSVQKSFHYLYISKFLK